MKVLLKNIIIIQFSFRIFAGFHLPLCKIATSFLERDVKFKRENWVEVFRLRYTENRLITLTSFLVLPYFYLDDTFFHLMGKMDYRKYGNS